MAVLRENRHSLMAMLEAFVHDPLINWRLLSATNVQPSSHAGSSVASSVVSSSIVSSAMSMDSESDYESSETSLHGPSEYSALESEVSSQKSSEVPSGKDEIPHCRSDSISIPDQTSNPSATLLDDRNGVRSAGNKVDDAQETSDKQESGKAISAVNQMDKFCDDQDATATISHGEGRPDEKRHHDESTSNPKAPRQVSSSLAAPRPRQEEKDAVDPPLPSSLSSRPMSLSKSIPLPKRKLPPRAPALNRLRDDTIDENEEATTVEKIDYATTNLHAEMSSLAASVSSVGHSSLSRSFSITQAQLQTQSQKQQPRTENGPTTQGERPPLPPSTPLPRIVPTVSTSFVSVTAAAHIPPSSDAVPPSATSNDLHANRSVRERELLSALGPEGIAAPRVALNEKAVAVIRRVQAKLSGRDFEGDGEPLDVSAQVQRLISQATSHENLCQCYIGWCPFW